jgi:hypothetical protein
VPPAPSAVHRAPCAVRPASPSPHGHEEVHVHAHGDEYEYEDD